MWNTLRLLGVSQCESAVAAGLSACSVSPQRVFFFFLVDHVSRMISSC